MAAVKEAVPGVEAVIDNSPNNGEHAERTRDGAGLARNGRGGTEPQAGGEASPPIAEVLAVTRQGRSTGRPL